MRSALLLAAMALSATNAYASISDSNGCGPGWFIFTDTSLVSSFAREITNGVLSPVVTVGMTLGTSGCTRHSFVMNDKGSLEFASKSFDILRQDLAKGSGEHLNAYISSFGCSELMRPELSGKLQKAFKNELYKTQDPLNYVEATRLMINVSSNRALCS